METNNMAEESSAAYAKLRPPPPQVYVDTVMAYVKEKISSPLKNALDVGCGTGQCTLFLSPHFQHVLGLDLSSAQIREAKKSAEHLPNVEFGVSAAESLPVESGTIQLLTAASCLHYLDVETFYAEAKRVLTPNGVIAVSAMLRPVLKSGNSSVDQKMNEHFSEYVQFIMKTVDCAGFQLILDRYNSVKLPFSDTRRIDGVWSVKKCSVAHFKFTLSSWYIFPSVVKKKGKEASEKLLSEFAETLMRILQSTKPQEETTIELHTEYVILLGRKSERD